MVGNVNVKLRRELEDMRIEIHNIAYGCEGFRNYDECDLHIGYRVHAHIYNLSRRKRSILIEEDVRGAGVNHALGLWHLRAYENKRRLAHTTYEKIYNKYMIIFR